MCRKRQLCCTTSCCVLSPAAAAHRLSCRKQQREGRYVSAASPVPASQAQSSCLPLSPTCRERQREGRYGGQPFWEDYKRKTAQVSEQWCLCLSTVV